MARKKISLIGGGNIGGTLAHLISLNELGDVVLLDIDGSKAKGKALDISQSSYVSGSCINIIGSDNYEDIKNSDVIIITAGIPRKEGMGREGLIEENTKVIKRIGEEIKKYSPNSFVICITNPLDAMVWVLQQSSGLPTNKVVGMAGVLDGSRFSYFLSKELGISVANIQSLVLGGHGDNMVPVLSYTTISGIPIANFIEQGKIKQETIDKIIERTRQGGGEIVKLLGKGSAFYAPAMSALLMAESYLFDQKKLLTCASFVKGKYGVDEIYMGVPSIIGSNGIEDIIEITLNKQEQDSLSRSATDVKSLIEIAKNYM